MLHTSRHRNVSFVERWTNTKAFLIGFLTGRGYSSEQIADQLGDGTSSATIRTMWAKWQVKGVRQTDEVAVMVPMTAMARAHLYARAAQNNLSIEEYSRRLLICASMPRDLYSAIVPEDQFP